MKILVDENMPLAEALFSSLGTVVKKAGRAITRQDLLDVDALMVRSVTRVDAALVMGTPVKFVGTATIGTDHIALDALAAMGIRVANAPGCNAQAVVEYVFAALLALEHRRQLRWRDATIGIVGLGNVGSRLRKTLCAGGCQVIACDPPLAAQGVTGLVSFEDIAKADIISFHTPLTHDGMHPTWHLADHAWLQALRHDVVLINAARGPVIDNRALSEVLLHRPDLSVVLDVWEGEPLLDIELAQRVDIATPHIAGYSYDGKAKGTWQVYEQFCAFLGVPTSGSWQALVPADHALTLDVSALMGKASAASVVNAVYDIGHDDATLRNTLTLPPERRAAAFDQLRKHYRLRREFSTVALHEAAVLQHWPAGERELLRAMGFEWQAKV